MANATATITVTDTWYDSKREHVIGTVVITNFNYITNGLPITWIGQEFVKSGIAPVFAMFTGVNGFLYTYDYTNATIRIYKRGAIPSTPAADAALLEETGGSALTSGVSTDSIKSYSIHKLI